MYWKCQCCFDTVKSIHVQKLNNLCNEKKQRNFKRNFVQILKISFRLALPENLIMSNFSFSVPFMTVTSMGGRARLSVISDSKIISSDEKAQELIDNFFKELKSLKKTKSQTNDKI